jgi:hypothetical protein
MTRFTLTQRKIGASQKMVLAMSGPYEIRASELPEMKILNY